MTMPSNNSTPAITGGNVDYYLIPIPSPKRIKKPYVVEVEDISEALGMNFAEATILKALVRLCQIRKGRGKPGSTRRYEVQKIDYYGQRLIAQCDQADDSEGLEQTCQTLLQGVPK